jgi:hypothetical protein
MPNQVFVLTYWVRTIYSPARRIRQVAPVDKNYQRSATTPHLNREWHDSLAGRKGV